MLDTHSVGSSSLLVTSRLSRWSSSSFNLTLIATGTRWGGITTGVTLLSTSNCSLPPILFIGRQNESGFVWNTLYRFCHMLVISPFLTHVFFHSFCTFSLPLPFCSHSVDCFCIGWRSISFSWLFATSSAIVHAFLHYSSASGSSFLRGPLSEIPHRSRSLIISSLRDPKAQVSSIVQSADA